MKFKKYLCIFLAIFTFLIPFPALASDFDVEDYSDFLTQYDINYYVIDCINSNRYTSNIPCTLSTSNGNIHTLSIVGWNTVDELGYTYGEYQSFPVGSIFGCYPDCSKSVSLSPYTYSDNAGQPQTAYHYSWDYYGWSGYHGNLYLTKSAGGQFSVNIVWGNPIINFDSLQNFDTQSGVPFINNPNYYRNNSAFDLSSLFSVILDYQYGDTGAGISLGAINNKVNLLNDNVNALGVQVAELNNRYSTLNSELIEWLEDYEIATETTLTTVNSRVNQILTFFKGNFFTEFKLQSSTLISISNGLTSLNSLLTDFYNSFIEYVGLLGQYIVFWSNWEDTDFGSFPNWFNSADLYLKNISDYFDQVKELEAQNQDSGNFNNFITGIKSTNTFFGTQSQTVIDTVSNSVSGFSSTSPTTITVHIGSTKLAGIQIGNFDLPISNSWFTPYKSFSDNIFSAFMWIFFMFEVFKQLPNIINGQGMTLSTIFRKTKGDD